MKLTVNNERRVTRLCIIHQEIQLSLEKQNACFFPTHNTIAAFTGPEPVRLVLKKWIITSVTAQTSSSRRRCEMVRHTSLTLGELSDVRRMRKRGKGSRRGEEERQEEGREPPRTIY